MSTIPNVPAESGWLRYSGPPPKAPKVRQPEVSLDRRGVLRLNAPAAQLLAGASHVALYYEQNAGAIGIQPEQQPGPGALKLVIGRGSGMLGIGAFLRRYELPTPADLPIAYPLHDNRTKAAGEPWSPDFFVRLEEGQIKRLPPSARKATCQQPERKTCRECGQEKPLSEYGAHPAFKDGLDNRCRRCRQELDRQKRAESDPAPDPGIRAVPLVDRLREARATVLVALAEGRAISAGLRQALRDTYALEEVHVRTLVRECIQEHNQRPAPPKPASRPRKAAKGTAAALRRLPEPSDSELAALEDLPV